MLSHSPSRSRSPYGLGTDSSFVISIVAVHGLDPLGRKLHAEATWTAGNALWLQDFLPQRLPNARILLFDYNANVAFQTSTAGVLEQAESLLNQLEIARAVGEKDVLARNNDLQKIGPN